VQFSWDPAKARSNLRKHGVSFDEAAAVFRDPLARIHDDPGHSAGESRELIVGRSSADRLLLVSFVERGTVVRIIHARRTDRDERRRYEESINQEP
jgi:uncharacterized DUF497 family protein